jgi:hypothetical protein
MQIPLVMTIIGPDRTGWWNPSRASWPITAATGWRAACAGSVANSRAFCAWKFRRRKNPRCSPRWKNFPASMSSSARTSRFQKRGRRQTDKIGNRRQRPARHRPRNHQRARAGERQRRGIFQRSRQRADVRRNLVQSGRAIAVARPLRPRRVEKKSGKNRRRSAGGRFVCGIILKFFTKARLGKLTTDARRGGYAGVHARGHAGQRQGAGPARTARDGHADHPRQHLSPQHPARTGHHPRRRRPAQIHELGTCPFSPTAAVSKFSAWQNPQGQTARRGISLAPGRLAVVHRPEGIHGNPARAGLGHRHGF